MMKFPVKVGQRPGIDTGVSTKFESCGCMFSYVYILRTYTYVSILTLVAKSCVILRCSCSEVFYKTCVLKNFESFTRKHLCRGWSLKVKVEV